MADQIFRTISKNEWHFIWLIIGLVIVVTTLPYLYGYLTSPGYFLWSNYTNFGDVTVYWSLIQQASQGKFFLENLYTSEFSYSLMIRPFWLSLGLVVKLTHLPQVFIYQLARIVFAAGLLFFLYLFLAYFINDRFQRKICFLLFAFGSGIGAFIEPLYVNFSSYLTKVEMLEKISADLLLPELNIFVTIFHSSILPFALLIELIILFLFINPQLKPNSRLNICLFLLVIILGLSHPYDVFTLLVIPTFFILLLGLIKILKGRSDIDLTPFLVKLIIIFLASVIIFSYYLFLIKFDPFFPTWTKSNLTESPPILNLITGYGFIFIFSLFGLFLWPNKKNDKYLFILTWLVINFFIAYLPFSYQRRLLNTLFIPLVILASFGLTPLLKLVFKFINNKFLQHFIIVVLFLILGASNISVLVSNIIFYSQKDPSFYFKDNYYQAALWLKTKKDKIILATPIISNPLPAISGNKVYIGHVHQTVDYFRKFDKIKLWFFKNNEDDENKKAWLKDNKIDFIFYSDVEKQLGGFEPTTKPYLKEVYSNLEVQIYQVL